MRVSGIQQPRESILVHAIMKNRRKKQTYISFIFNRTTIRFLSYERENGMLYVEKFKCFLPFLFLLSKSITMY